MYLKIINFHQFLGFWLKSQRNGLGEYSKWPDPLNVIALKFLYFLQRKKIMIII